MRFNPKYHLPGIPQHIVVRSSGCHRCFSCDADYQFYLDSLKKAATAFNCQLHAFVLMPDHVHMVVTPGVEFGVSNMMQSLQRRYKRYIKSSYRRIGSPWSSSYKSSLIDSRNYLFACMCYVEVNPVRAGIVSVPSEYRWSSYHANAYNKAPGGIVNPHAMYLELGQDDASRCEAYLRLFCSRVEVGSVHTIRNALHQELVLGSTEFKDRIGQMIKTRERMIRAEKLAEKKKAA
jgi:putative transposase